MPKKGLPEVFSEFWCIGELVDRQGDTWRHPLAGRRRAVHREAWGGASHVAPPDWRGAGERSMETPRGWMDPARGHVAPRGWRAHSAGRTEARGCALRCVRDRRAWARCGPGRPGGHVSPAHWRAPPTAFTVGRDTWQLSIGLAQLSRVLGHVSCDTPGNWISPIYK